MSIFSQSVKVLPSLFIFSAVGTVSQECEDFPKCENLPKSVKIYTRWRSNVHNLPPTTCSASCWDHWTFEYTSHTKISFNLTVAGTCYNRKIVERNCRGGIF